MKKLLRQQKLLERLNHHPKIKKVKDVEILKTILNLKEFKKAQNIVLYLPIKGEVDLKKLFTQKKSFILPKVKNEKSLDLYYVKNLKKDIEKGYLNILEPKSHLEKVKLKDIDLALVPGIAFSKKGHRIGYGKGFYDRLLKKLPCPKIGVAYDFQIVKNTSAKKYDIPMDMVVTESEIIIS